MNYYMEIDSYMKRLIKAGLTDEEVLKRRVYGYIVSIIPEDKQHMLEELRKWINCCLITIREEYRRAGEDFSKVTLDVVRERMRVVL